MTDIVPPSDPRVRVELTFHPEGKEPLTVSLPRPDFVDDPTEAAMQADFRRMKQDAADLIQQIRRTQKKRQIEAVKYDKAFAVWEKKLHDPDCEDPGPEPEEPEPWEFPEVSSERDAERRATLIIYKHLVTPAEYRVLSKCSTAELMQGRALWEKASEVPLGELLASPTSSAESTEGRSERTSSAEDGLSGTSGTGSPGETSETS